MTPDDRLPATAPREHIPPAVIQTVIIGKALDSCECGCHADTCGCESDCRSECADCGCYPYK